MNYPSHFHEAHLPTPIIPVRHFFKKMNDRKIYLKRDDLTGIELSGNKVRKLDFLMKDAQEQGANHIITCGGIQSNHCRATAFYAAKMGMKSTLVLRGEMPANSTGNLLLDQLLGADIKLVTAEEYKKADQIMEQIAARAPEPAYVIPEGGSNEIGAWGYIKAFNEIMEQEPSIETIVSASGSGGTHAGLLLGKLLSGSSARILSVNVCDDEAYFVNKIDSIMQRFCSRYNFALSWKKEEIHILDGFVGSGYAQIGATEAALIKRFAREEGIVLDPVYTAKAMLGFQQNLEKDTIPGKKIVFIHTGGIFGTFAFAEKF